MIKLILMLFLFLNIGNVFANTYIMKIEKTQGLSVIKGDAEEINKQAGTNGACGIAQDKYTEAEPSTQLCSTEYGNSAIILNGYTYSWNCLGSPESETNSRGNAVACKSYKDLPLSDYGVSFYRVYGTSLEVPYGEKTQISQLVDGNYTIASQNFVSLNISGGNLITLNQNSGSVYGTNTYAGYVISGIPNTASFTVVENTTPANVSMFGDKIYFNYAGKTIPTGGRIKIKMNLNESETSCGTMDQTYTSLNLSNMSEGLCSIGQVSNFSSTTNNYNWSCTLPSIGKSKSCTAYKNPVCGSDHGITLESAPTNFCSNGIASAYTQDQNGYYWTCSLNNKLDNCVAYTGVNLLNSSITAYRVAHSSLATPYQSRTITNATHILNQEYMVPIEDLFAYKIVDNNTVHLIQKKSGSYGATYTYNGYVLKLDKINNFEVLQNTTSIPIVQNGNDLYINYKGRSVSAGNVIILRIN